MGIAMRSMIGMAVSKVVFYRVSAPANSAGASLQKL